jgi:hypothetical protein
MNTKFTEGPWEVEYDNSDREQWYEVGPAKVAWSYRYGNHEDDTALADAHLIAAAPDMYEALERLMFRLADFEPHYRALFQEGRAALAKANGETV